MQQRYKTAVIGGGFGGRLSLDALQASSRFEPIACADPSESIHARLEKDYARLKVFSDYRTMLEECPVDVACIAAPAPLHYLLGMELLNLPLRGIVIEKPLACKTKDARKFLDTVYAHKLPMLVPHGMFALPGSQQVLARVHDGEIGRLSTIEVQNSVDLLNAAIHWLTFILVMLKDDNIKTVLSVLDVSGETVNDGIQVETQGLTSYTTESGVRVFLQSGVRTKPVSTKLPEEQRKGALLRISGSKGVIEMHAWAQTYWILNDKYPCGEFIDAGPAEYSSPHQWIYENLAKQIDTESPDYGIAELSWQALQLIEGAYLSDQGNCCIEFPLQRNYEYDGRRWQPGRPKE